MVDISDFDSGTGHESEFVYQLITDSDTATATDAQSAPAQPFTESDTAVATETESVFVSAHAGATPRWIFVDPTSATPVEAQFEINPSSTTEIVRSKAIVYQNTLAPNTKSIIFENQDSARTMSWTGTTLTQAQYQMFVDWYNKRTSIRLLDDLTRMYSIYITEFTPKRVRNAEYPWLHTYDMKALVLSEG